MPESVQRFKGDLAQRSVALIIRARKEDCDENELKNVIGHPVGRINCAALVEQCIRRRAPGCLVRPARAQGPRSAPIRERHGSRSKMSRGRVTHEMSRRTEPSRLRELRACSTLRCKDRQEGAQSQISMHYYLTIYQADGGLPNLRTRQSSVCVVPGRSDKGHAACVKNVESGRHDTPWFEGSLVGSLLGPRDAAAKHSTCSSTGLAGQGR